MKFKYMEEFLALIDMGEYLKAAEKLQISQPMLSKHINAIESELGVPLLKSSSHGIHLTKYGEVFRDYAEQLTELQKTSIANLHEEASSNCCNWTIGVTPTMFQFRAMDFFRLFHQKYRQVNTQFFESSSAELYEKIRNKQCDFAFLRDSERLIEKNFDPNIHKVQFLTDHMVVVLPKSHVLAAEECINVGQLCDENFLLPPSNTSLASLYRICLEICQQAGFTPNCVYSSINIRNIVELVAGGMGVSLLPRSMVLGLGYQDVVVIDSNPFYRLTIDMLYRQLPEKGEIFLDAIEQYKKSSYGDMIL